MSEFQKLEVWQKSMLMVKDAYEIIRLLPNEERFCLGSQMRNCAVSVPSNIAEGQARKSTKEFLHHLSFAIGSAAELETQLLLCEMLGYVTKNNIENILGEIHVIDTMLNRLINALKKNI